MKKIEFIKTSRGRLYSPHVARKENVEGKKVLRTKRDLFRVPEWDALYDLGVAECLTAKMLLDRRFKRQLQKAGVIE